MEKPVLFKKDSDNWIFVPLSPGADILMMTLKNKELEIVYNDKAFKTSKGGSDQSRFQDWKRNFKKTKKRPKVIHSRLPRKAIGIAMKVKTHSFTCKNCKKEKRAVNQ